MLDLGKLRSSFRFGFAGIRQVLASEQNMRIHSAITVAVIGAGIFFQIERWEWAVLLLSIGMVLTAECLNTGIERLGDRASSDNDELIGLAKDAGAAAVLISSLAAAVVGLIVFLPRVFSI